MSDIVTVRKTWLIRLEEVLRPATAAPPTLLSASSGLLAIAAIYLYFTGYLYAYHFYKTFGVTLESLDLSSQFYFVHAFLVIGTVRGVLIMAVLMLLAGGYAAQKVRLTVLLIGLLAAFPALYFLTFPVAREKAQIIRQSPESSISLRVKKGGDAARTAASAVVAPADKTPAPIECGSIAPPLTTDQLVAAGDAGCLHTLLETKDRIVMYFQPPPSPILPNDVPAVTVYTVLRSDLDMSVVTSN